MCAPCKIILDCGRVLPASARLLADHVGPKSPLYAPARYLAAISEGVADAIAFAVAHPDVTEMRHGGSFEEAIERAHAWSELSCHRAKMLRTFVYPFTAEPDAEAEAKITPSLLMGWAESHRLHGTALFGGEYHGKYRINGTDGIELNE